MQNKRQELFHHKFEKSPDEKPIIAREMALLRILEGKMPTRIPVLDCWEPSVYLFDYRLIPGVTINSGLYLDFSRKQQLNLAEDIAIFLVALHEEIPVEFAQALGFTTTKWPLAPDILRQVLSNKLIGATQSFFERFLEVYEQVLAKPVTAVFLHHDFHGNNMLVHRNTGRLQGVIDFEDAAIGDPYQEFRLLYEIDSKLMEDVAFLYCQKTLQKFDIQRIHAYYLATEYSRMVEIIQGKTTKHELNHIAVNIMCYEEKYGSIPKRQRGPLEW